MIGSVDPIFFIKRFDPNEAFEIQECWIKNNLVQKSSYRAITDEQRYKLIYNVLNNKLKLSEAATLNGIKYTTAKNILDVYQREGRIEKKKVRNLNTKKRGQEILRDSKGRFKGVDSHHTIDIPIRKVNMND